MIDTAPLALLGAAGIWLALRIFGALITDEVKGSVPILCRALVHNAVKRLPEGDQERWNKEWCAELHAKRDRPLSALKYSMGIRLSIRAHAAALIDAENSDSETGNARISKYLGEIRGQYDDGYITALELLKASWGATKGMGWRAQAKQLIGKIDGNAQLDWTVLTEELSFQFARFRHRIKIDR